MRAPDLLRRNFSATRPDQTWVADFTYCSTWSGIVYVAFDVDVFSLRIVGWKAARTMGTSLVLDALNMAAWARRGVDINGVVCHSDAGSQYTSIAYTDRLDEIGAAPSIGTVGDSYDNALAESAIGLFKTELHRNPAAIAANGGPWKGLDDLEAATCGWVCWFNEARIHSQLDDHTPAEVEAAWQREHPATPHRGEHGMTPSSNESVTIPCPACASPVEPIGKRRYCRGAARLPTGDGRQAFSRTRLSSGREVVLENFDRVVDKGCLILATILRTRRGDSQPGKPADSSPPEAVSSSATTQPLWNGQSTLSPVIANRWGSSPSVGGRVLRRALRPDGGHGGRYGLREWTLEE